MTELKPLVLLVDDSPTFITALGNSLMDEFQIKVATSGDEALNLVDREPPDLVLQDVMMPDMDGFEVCRRLKQNPQTQNIPVIFLTAKGEVADQEQGFAVGGVDFISKPYDLSVVRARMRTKIKLKQHTELLEKLISIDPLIGIPNQKGFEQVLDSEWKRASRGHYSLALLMIRVDHFEVFNDASAQDLGNDCLRAIAHSVRDSLLRPQDFIARYGAEEFAVVLPVCDLEGARKVGEHSRAGVEALQHPHVAGLDHVTISVGISAFIPSLTGSVQSLLDTASQSLFQAKQAGGNVVRGSPSKAGETKPSSLEQGGEIPSSKPTILIVDDMPSVLQNIAETFGTEFDIQIATSGEQALQMADERVPDLVLLDVLMPGMDGYEVCRRFKANPKLETIPIIFMTVLGERESEASGLALGAADYVSKPVDPELLRLRVRNHLTLNQQRRRDHDMVEQLKSAMADVTELRGLMPICAWCQKVRNDQGYWEGLTNYVSHHLGTSWTHGICPECQYKILHEPTA